MNFKSIVATALIGVTVFLAYLLSSITKLYRMFIIIDENTSKNNLDLLNKIRLYLNASWYLIFIIIIGLVLIIVLQHKDRAKEYIKNMY